MRSMVGEIMSHKRADMIKELTKLQNNNCFVDQDIITITLYMSNDEIEEHVNRYRKIIDNINAYQALKERVLSDNAASFWLKGLVKDLDKRDIVDVTSDIIVLKKLVSLKRRIFLTDKK